MKRDLHLRNALASGLLAVSLTLALPAAQAAQGSLPDVPNDAWFARAVNYCWTRDVLEASADGAFDPGGALTRGMVASALYQLYDRPQVSLEEKEYESGAANVPKDDGAAAERPFPDVAPDDPRADAILWAWQEGLVTGYEDGRFGPDDLVTREQLAVIMWHTLGEPLSQVAAPFADKGDIARWSIDAVEWAYWVGLISGKPGNLFDPTGTATRAEGATVLMNYDLTFLHPAEEDEDASQPGAIPANPYDSAAFTVENGFLTYQGDFPSFVGVDVSAHQQEIDWSKVAAAGVDFAMIRAGYRGYTVGAINQDSYFAYNIRQALANGLDVGVYFFSQAVTEAEAEEEARQLLAWIDGYDITYPVVFDWEQVSEENSRTKDTSGETVTACAKAFCKLIEEAGYIPMTYGSPSKIYAGGLDLAQVQQYPFWLAHYTTDWATTSFRYQYHMWQYSSNGQVDGIPTRVDLDLCLTDWSTWGRD